MTCPWYISVRAVRDLLALQKRPQESDGPAFDAAEKTLMSWAEETIASGRVPKRLDSGALRYRGPAPERLTLIVTDGPRPEGDLPQLVRVLNGCAK